MAAHARDRGGVRRAYADLREHADVGGGREAIVARGEKRATTDPATAQVLLARRLEQLDGLRRGRALHGLTAQATLADFARTHLEAKAKSGKVTDTWLELSQLHLERAVEYFGAERDLASITTTDVRGWCEHLQAAGLSGGTVRHHLNALSNLYARARAECRVEQHVAKLGERLAALNLGTTIDTTGLDSQPYRVTRSAVTPRA